MLTRRKAFTIIELLLVIGVLVILIGIVVWGLKGAIGAGGDKATRATMQNLTSMSEELNRKTRLAGIEGSLTQGAVYDITNTPGGETAPGLVTSDSKNFDRLGPAVQRTAMVMARISSIPDNKKALEKFPSDQKLAVPPSPTLPSGGMVVLDGWHNPILFVPPSGLAGVYAKPNANGTPQTTYASGQNYSKGARVIVQGQYWTATTSTNSSPTPPEWYPGIRSPDGRAFWVSAGADGTFGTQTDLKAGSGDDNIYSFEQ